MKHDHSRDTDMPTRSWPASPTGSLRDDSTVVDVLKRMVATFTTERDWDRFHTPKNLAIALAVEAGELLQLYLWVDDRIEGGRPAPGTADVEAEIADIAICLLNLCNTNEIDLAAAIERKLAAIGAKYPVERVKGSALKYNEYTRDQPVGSPATRPCAAGIPGTGSEAGDGKTSSTPCRDRPAR